VKLLESWLLWIATDLISIPLVWNEGGHLTALLFVTLAGLSVQGMRSWAPEARTTSARQARSATSADPPPA
jgi:nicotinamide riboside transporter PnuC